MITSAWPLIGLISPLSFLTGQLTERRAGIGGRSAKEEELVKRCVGVAVRQWEV